MSNNIHTIGRAHGLSTYSDDHVHSVVVRWQDEILARANALAEVTFTSPSEVLEELLAELDGRPTN